MQRHPLQPYAYPVIAKGSTESKTFVVTNTGGAATGALSVALSGKSVAVFHKTADACTAVSLGPHKSCTVTVAYQPATEGAADSVTLMVTSKKPVAKASASLTGTSFGPPIANPDNYTTSEDTVLTVSAPGVLANDSDPDGDTLSVAQVNGSAADVGKAVSLPSGAVLTVNPDGSFAYDPNGSFAAGGTDSFTYTVEDSHGDEAIATVTITVTASGNLSVSASLGSGVTLPLLNCIQVTLGDFSAVLTSSGGATQALPLAPTAPGSSTFGASFTNLPPGSYSLTLQAPTNVSFN